MNKGNRFIHPSSFILLLQPAHDRHARAATDLGFDLELVNEPLRAGQALAESAPRGEAVAHGGGDVGNAGAAVLEDETETGAAPRVGGRLRDHSTAPRVLDDVAREFRGHGREARLVNQREADGGGDRAHLAARDSDGVLALKGALAAPQAL